MGLGTLRKVKPLGSGLADLLAAEQHSGKLCSQGGDSAPLRALEAPGNGLVGLRVQMRARWRASLKQTWGQGASTGTGLEGRAGERKM